MRKNHFLSAFPLFVAAAFGLGAMTSTTASVAGIHKEGNHLLTTFKGSPRQQGAIVETYLFRFNVPVSLKKMERSVKKAAVECSVYGGYSGDPIQGIGSLSGSESVVGSDELGPSPEPEGGLISDGMGPPPGSGNGQASNVPGPDHSKGTGITEIPLSGNGSYDGIITVYITNLDSGKVLDIGYWGCALRVNYGAGWLQLRPEQAASATDLTLGVSGKISP